MTTSVGRVTADAQSPTLARGHNDLVDAILGQNGKSLPGLTLANADAAVSTVLDIRVGGASGGDPFVRFAVDGVTTWSAGIDNSDSDAWVLAASGALGTTNVLRGTSTGLTVPGTLGVTGVATFGTADVNILEQTGTPAAAGAIRLRTAQSFNARNNANSADLTLVRTDAADNLYIGQIGAGLTALYLESSGDTYIYGGAALRIVVTGTGLGFFGAAAAAKQTLAAVATDLPTVITLANSIRSALIAYSLTA